MYGLPADFDGGFFAGQVLVQVCVNENQISLQFEHTVVTIEGEYSCGVLSHEDHTAREVPDFEPMLLKLLGKSVTHAAGTPDGTLSLKFDNGLRLRCFDDPNYESYQIKHGDVEIIV